MVTAPFHVLNSTNVTVRRLELDGQPLVFTQGKGVALEAAPKTVEVRIDPGYDESDAQSISRLTSRLVFTDPTADTWDHSRWWLTIFTRERLAPGQWRFTLSQTPLPAYR